jgi:predicted nucleic-acid-binding Zn-ribbon protein
MKTTGTCPKCCGRKVLQVSPVQYTYCDAGGTLRNFDVQSAHVRTGKKGLLGGDATELETAGPYETLVCAACGYAEWYAPMSALEALKRMSARSATVRVVEREPPPGRPFR